MANTTSLLQTIHLDGLAVAPPQVLGSIRLVPLLRRTVRDDLRLARRSYGDDAMVVAAERGRFYASYVPHGLVLSWSDDGTPAAVYATHLEARDGRRFTAGPCSVRLAHRMVRREEPNRLRMLPLHLAMEGFLALHFGGPDVAWSEYSRSALSSGLSPRVEESAPGAAIRGLEDALRVFEIHEGQTGILVFVADALASAFVVPHPDDYRALHRTLLEDFYGELVYQYGLLHTETARMEAPIDDASVTTLDDLRRALEGMKEEWSAFQIQMAEGLLGRRVRSERVYRAGAFQLQRFVSDLDPALENHIGEAIVREDGTLEYLKTFRLSAAQTRRAYLLSQLAAHNWNLEATAAHLRQDKDDLVRRLEKAGFGYLLKEHVIKAARRGRDLWG